MDTPGELGEVGGTGGLEAVMTRIEMINAILMGYIRSQRRGSNGSLIIVFSQSIICPLVWMAMA